MSTIKALFPFPGRQTVREKRESENECWKIRQRACVKVGFIYRGNGCVWADGWETNLVYQIVNIDWHHVIMFLVILPRKEERIKRGIAIDQNHMRASKQHGDSLHILGGSGCYVQNSTTKQRTFSAVFALDIKTKFAENIRKSKNKRFTKTPVGRARN